MSLWLMIALTLVALAALGGLVVLARMGRVLSAYDAARQLPTQADPDAEEDGLWPPANRREDGEGHQ